MTVTTITSLKQFREVINSGNVVAIDFSAEWCGPCKMISPRFDALSNDYTNIQFYKVDVDDQPEIAQECGIRAMPTFHIFKDGNKLADLVGADVGKLTTLIQTHQSA